MCSTQRGVGGCGPRRAAFSASYPASRRVWPAKPAHLVRGEPEDRDADGSVGRTLSSLDSLVPPQSPPPAAAADGAEQPEKQQAPEGEGEPWAWFDRPATPSQGPLRRKGMKAGSGGAYLDSEVITRDPMQLNVGARTSLADGAPPQLPESAPQASRLLAAAVAAVGAATITGLAPRLDQDTAAFFLAGDSWALLAASLQPVDWLETAASAGVLATAGAFAERRLGSALFTASFFLSGATAWLLYDAVSIVLGPVQVCGPHVGLAGCAAALAAFTARNWRVLGLAQQRGACLAASGGLAAVSLTALPAPLLFECGLPALLAFVLGWAAGPNLEVLRELDIADNSMTISGDEAELEVVVDRRTAPATWLAIGLASSLLLWASYSLQHPVAQVMEMLAGMDEDELRQLLEYLAAAIQADLAAELADPGVQQQLFELSPDQWSRSA